MSHASGPPSSDADVAYLVDASDEGEDLDATMDESVDPSSEEDSVDPEPTKRQTKTRTQVGAYGRTHKSAGGLRDLSIGMVLDSTWARLVMYDRGICIETRVRHMIDNCCLY